MPLSPSRRSECVLQSEIRNMTIECARIGGINLAQGVCDTPVPPEVRRAAPAAIEAGHNQYTRYDGVPELRRAIAAQLRELYGIDAEEEGEIIVSAGSTGAFYVACLALLNPGDEVILFEPYYGYHLQTLLAAEGVPRFVRLQPPEWTFDPADLERVASSRTRGIMVNTPANPSGKVFTREELQQIAEWARRHDCFVFTDEIYEHFVYDGRRHIPPITLPGMKERTIMISGYSKVFSITGWRIGYSLSDARWARPMGFFNDLVYVCAPAPLQHAVAEGIRKLPRTYYSDLRAEYQRKRDQICEALADAGLTPYVPQGSYYVLADISRVPGKTSKERAMRILKDTGVASVPGEAFYENGGETLTRFCFAKTPQDLDEACRRLRTLR